MVIPYVMLLHKERGCSVQVAREVREEAGVEVENVHILGSQPWPIGKSTVLRINAAFVKDPGNCMFDTPANHVHLSLRIRWQPQLRARAGSSAARLHAARRLVCSVHGVHACRQRRLVRADDRLYSKGEVRYAAHGRN